MRKGIKLAVLMMATMTCAVCVGQKKETYIYAEKEAVLRLDVWQPAVKRTDSACVVAVFGGGFVNGARDDEYQRAVAKTLIERGFTVVSPDYRLGLRDSARVAENSSLSKLRGLFQWTIDLAAEDCADVCAWVVKHAKEIGIRSERVILTGSSAGAIAVLQMDYYRANGMKQTASLPEGWQPAAVVPYAGAIMTYGKPQWKRPPAPTMLMHGKKDKVVDYKRFPPVVSHALYGSSTVYERMRKAGYATWIVRFEGVGHEVASWLPNSADLFCGFVDQVLHGRISNLDATMTDTELTPTKWTDMNVFQLYKR